MNNKRPLYQEPAERIKATELSKWLLSQGVSSVTTDDIAVLLAIPKNHVPQRMAAPKKRGEMVLLANGLWAPVPPEYMTWGAPPAIDIIDALMSHLDLSYYVGWLSAAAMYGASHHAPQVFQVAVLRTVREKTVGRSRLKFYQRNHVRLIEPVKKETRSGTVQVSSKETTLLDIASDIENVGGIDNAANLIIEMCETGHPDLGMIASLSSHYPASAIRRLGYMLEQFTAIAELDCLKAISSQRNKTAALLDPLSASNGHVDKNWMLKINREVEPDV
jgi:predicted transcriptional regulator of viral defense system